jgi:hypothetical protein
MLFIGWALCHIYLFEFIRVDGGREVMNLFKGAQAIKLWEPLGYAKVFVVCLWFHRQYKLWNGHYSFITSSFHSMQHNFPSWYTVVEKSMNLIQIMIIITIMWNDNKNLSINIVRLYNSNLAKCYPPIKPSTRSNCTVGLVYWQHSYNGH